MNVPRVAAALLLVVAALGAVPTTEGGGEKTNQLRILIDAAHPWRPPFGLDRVTQPLGMAQVAWLYEFERIRQRSEEGETITDVVDQIFTAYWP